MTVYSRQIASATRILNKKAGYATWRQIRNTGSADPNTPWLPAGETFTDYKVKIAFLPNTRVGYETIIAAINKTEIKTGSVIGYMTGAVPFEPSSRDVVLRPPIGTVFKLGIGIPYRIRNIDDLNVDGAHILFTIHFDI